MEKKAIKQSLDPVILVELEDIVLTEQPMPDTPLAIKDMLRKSIETFGIKYPLRITKDFEIIDGRTRYEIAKALGFKVVPCIVSDTEENPKEHILMYDLELGRRSLTNKERSRLEIEREKKLSNIMNELFRKHIKNIIPDLRPSIERIFKANGNLPFVIKIAALNKDEQEELVTKVVVNENVSGDVGQQLNQLTAAKKELSVELKSSKKELDDLQRKFDILNEEYVFLKNEAEEKIANQKTEIEKRIREQLSSNAPEEVRKLLAEHASTLTQKYEDEMEETLQRLREVSLSLDKKKEELEQKENELKQKEKDVKELKKGREDAAEEIMELKTALQGLVQPLKFINSLDTVFNDLNNIFSGIITAGVDKFEDDHKDKIKINLSKIESVFTDLKELFGVPLCSCRKDE